MNVTLLLSIGNRIKEQCENIKHIDIFNNQYVPNMDMKVKPFKKPAVFIEFSIERWTDQVNGEAEGDGLLRIHTVMEVYNDSYKIFEKDDAEQESTLAHYERPMEVHQALQDFVPEGALGGLTLINTITDHDYDNIIVEVREYAYRSSDSSANHKRDWVDADINVITPLPELVLVPVPGA
jgi:hypothetical protein